MGSFFEGVEGYAEPGKVPFLIQEEPPEKKGFSFEPISKDATVECIDAIVKAVPQAKWDREGLKHRLLAPNGLTIIARLRRVLVGVISGTLMTPSLPPSIGFMAVFDPESGRKGLGGYLIDEFIKEIQERVPKALCVDVSLSNLDTSSIALYSLKGFIVNGFIKNEVRSRFGEGVHDLVHLRRWLVKARPRSAA
jgi:hypothetical protein